MALLVVVVVVVALVFWHFPVSFDNLHQFLGLDAILLLYTFLSMSVRCLLLKTVRGMEFKRVEFPNNGV